MKKLRLITITASIILLLLMAGGITILIINQRLDFLDTLYESIAFSIGIAGMLVSVISQIDAYRQERIVSQLKNELTELTKESDAQIKSENSINHKLDDIQQELTSKPRYKKHPTKKS